jgi:hypothetical protein
MGNSTPATSADEIVREGEKHYLSNKGKYQNPYPIHSDKFNRFERGWVQALKKNAVGLLSPIISDTKFPIINTPTQPRNNSEIEKRAAEYKARKG